MNNQEFYLLTAIEKLNNWVKRQQYSGWDPYDRSTKNFSKIIANLIPLKVLTMQFHLYSPINFRPFLKIKKDISNKALALFSRANLNLFRLTGNINYLNEAKKLLDVLGEKKIQADPHAWSDYFGYVGPSIPDIEPSTPDIVVTTEAIKTLLTAFKITDEGNYLKEAESAIHFLRTELFTESSNYCYFKYTSKEKNRIVFNAQALALECFSERLKYGYIEDLLQMGTKVTEFLLDNQDKSGFWPYSYYIDSNHFYKQIDYHQGFILDGLYSFLPYLNKNLQEKTITSIQKGADFYMNKQFTKKGISFYRYPVRYPIDIHNHAQGIITFSKLHYLDKKYLNIAEKITRWTIENMQSQEGYFYSHKWPIVVNKIPYMRWGQAWMMLALSTLLGVMEHERKN